MVSANGSINLLDCEHVIVLRINSPFSFITSKCFLTFKVLFKFYF